MIAKKQTLNNALTLGIVLALITVSLIVLVKLGGEWTADLRGLLIVLSGMTALGSLDAFSRFLER